tara:strand:- start:172 stop:498 length:327 start_codon:yes stop_codon:yes gene_type:complete
MLSAFMQGWPDTIFYAALLELAGLLSLLPLWLVWLCSTGPAEQRQPQSPQVRRAARQSRRKPIPGATTRNGGRKTHSCSSALPARALASIIAMGMFTHNGTGSVTRSL